MRTVSFELSDGVVNLSITVSEMADGTLQFDVDVLDDTGVIGDLNGLFFDLADDSIADNLTLMGTDLTGENIDANSVTKVDNYNNLQGAIIKEDGKFDVGVQFGTQGMAKDDIQSTTFYLGTKDGSALSIESILNQDFAARLTSVGELDGSRDGSVKISGTSDGQIFEPEPEPEASANLAINDSMTVSNTNTFSPFFLTDMLDSFEFSILANDTTDGTDPYSGLVIAGNDQPMIEDLILVGSNGGLLKMNPDGTVDFSANNEFNHLSGDETDQTQFTYTIEGGSTAVLDVTVFAFEGFFGGGEAM